MQFTIDRTKGVVSVSGVPLPIDTSSLPTNIRYVFFSDAGGNLIYNDRAAIAEPFSDPSPYQGLLNAWMTAAAAASPPLLLGQAQKLKCGMVNAIGSMKRQLPLSVKIGSGSYPWDASDLAVSRFITPISGLIYLDPLNSLIATETTNVSSLSQLVADLNAEIVTLNGWAVHFNTLDSNFGNLGSGIQGAITAIINEVNQAIVNAEAIDSGLGGALDPGLMSAFPISGVTGPVTTSAPIDAAVSTLAENFSMIQSLTVPKIQLIPVGSASPVTLTPSDLQAVVVAVAAQNIKYQTINLAKQAEVNALSTISAVASYDATTGW
jgi:hypothetical protein